MKLNYNLSKEIANFLSVVGNEKHKTYLEGVMMLFSFTFKELKPYMRTKNFSTLILSTIKDYKDKGFDSILHELQLGEEIGRANKSTISVYTGIVMEHFVKELNKLNPSNEQLDLLYRIAGLLPLTPVTEHDWIAHDIYLTFGPHKNHTFRYHSRTPKLVLLDTGDIYYTDYTAYREDNGAIFVDLTSWKKISLPFDVPTQPIKIKEVQHNE